MSANGEVSFAWGDDEQTFRLGLGQLRELQEKTGVGPKALMRRIRSGDWKVDDLRETLRLGLIGGGKTPVEAFKLVQTYCDGRPLDESEVPAFAVVAAAVAGVPDDPIPMVSGKKPKAARKTKTRKSPSPQSTEQPAP